MPRMGQLGRGSGIQADVREGVFRGGHHSEISEAAIGEVSEVKRARALPSQWPCPLYLPLGPPARPSLKKTNYNIPIHS